MTTEYLSPPATHLSQASSGLSDNDHNTIRPFNCIIIYLRETLKRKTMRLGKLILSFTLLVLFHLGFAQSKTSSQADTFIDPSDNSLRIYKLAAYTPVSKVSWRDSVYRFPAFEYGRITLATGFSPEEKIRLNYNLYLGQMQMITTTGDTSHVKQLKELKFISIGDHLFCHEYNVGYIEIIHKSPVALGVLNIMITADPDERTTTSKYDRYYMKKGYYYFIGKDNKPSKATRATIQRLYPDQQKNLKAYLSENRIDFENQSDLIKLLKFCNGLSAENQN